MKIGIISSHFENLTRTSVVAYETEQLCSSLKRFQIEFELIDPRKISYGIIGDKPFCKFCDINNIEHSVKELDVLLVRRTRDYVEIILDFLEYAEKSNQKLVIFDSIKSFRRPTSKVSDIIERSEEFSQPDTQVLSYPSSIIRELQYPVILKPSHGYKGEDVESCNSDAELKEYLIRYFDDESSLGYGVLVQQQLEKNNEYRVVVIGGESVGCVKKTAGHENQVALNANEGAIFKKYDGLNKKEIVLLAEKVSQYMGYSFSGVDIIESNNRLYILECNRNPQFAAFDNAMGMRVADNIVEHISDVYKQKSTGTEVFHEQSNIKTSTISGLLPTIFIGSSSEGLSIAEVIQQSLVKTAEVTIWNQGVFEPGKIGFNSLVNKAKEFDIAIFPLSPDDLVTKRGESVSQPRDNVLFEIGLFMGALGANRIFLVVNSDDRPNMPSDFNGLTTINWMPHRSGNLKAALGSVSTEIKQIINKLC